MTLEAPLWLEPPGDIHPLWRSFDHAWYAGLHLGGPDAVGADEAQRHYHEVGADAPEEGAAAEGDEF